MNYLKLVNTPLSIFENSKYGAKASGESLLRWTSAGFNKLAITQLAVQYQNGNQHTYLPITDETKLNAAMVHINSDVSFLNSLNR